MKSSIVTVPTALYAVILGLGLALGLGSYLFGYGREKEYQAEMARLAPGDRVPVIAPDGSQGTVGWLEEDDAVRAGYRVEPKYVRLKSQANSASDLGLALLLPAVALASILGGFLVYRLLRMVLDRFIEPKWSCLVSGLLCAATLWCISGLVLALVELSRLPKVGENGPAA